MKKLGIDIDGVCADFVQAFYGLANELFDKQLHGPQYVWDFDDVLTKPQIDLIWQGIRSTKDFWQALEPLEGTSRLRYPVPNRELVFITSRIPTAGHTAHDQTCAWLRRHFHITYPQVLVVGGPTEKAPLCRLLGIETFIDDKRSTVLDMHGAGLKSYVKLAPYNSYEPFPEGVISVESLNEFLEQELKVG